ncbi:MAG TPA: hypothetical protein VGD27_11835 [Longimicrobiales bacterium]
MIIALSSAAAPNASLPELVEGCARRGLSALHLIAGHQHGVGPEMTDAALDDAVALTRAADVQVVAYEIDDAAQSQAAARICQRFGAMLVPGSVVLDAARENVAEAAAAFFARNADIPHITLRGGGPEAAQFEGRGIGGLMARLALMNYRGVLALAPSSTSVLPVWRTWLRRGRNWGCGSKTADPSLIQLG